MSAVLACLQPALQRPANLDGRLLDDAIPENTTNDRCGQDSCAKAALRGNENLECRKSDDRCASA